MPVKLSYINAKNEEIILDDDEETFAGELSGRTGFEMPEIETKTVTYGDGSQDIVCSRLKSREVTCYFWIKLDTKTNFEQQMNEVKSKILQTGSRMGDWGKLKIRQKDGTYRYLNCIYKGGFNGIVRDNNIRLKFSLSFQATDPLFYSPSDSQYIIATPATAKFLLMKDLYFSGIPRRYSPANYVFSEDNITNNPNGLYMRALPNAKTGGQYDFSKDTITQNPDSTYFQNPSIYNTGAKSLDCYKVYPTIKIEGTAKNISIYNALTDKSIILNSDIEVNYTNYILIETKPLKRKIVLVDIATGEETNLISNLTTDSTLDFPLERGVNTITYRNSYASPESKCTFTYTEGWLSCN